MIEELKSVIDIIKGMPHMVMWVLAGLLFYKVIVIGSIFGLLKICILKFHDVLTKPKPDQKITELYDISGHFINKQNVQVLMSLIEDIKHHTNKADEPEDPRYRSNYIHQSDMNWFICAVQEKKQREAKVES